MSFDWYLQPVRRLLAATVSVALLGTVSPALAHDSDDHDEDSDKKEVRVFRMGGDEDGEDEDNPRAFAWSTERAEAKGGYLGVRVQDITRSMMKARYLTTDEGALVNRVEDESPAEEAGMRRGDVIVEVNRRTIEDSNDLIETVRELKPGSKVDVIVLRDGLRKTLNVEVAKRPFDRMIVAPGFRWKGEGMDPEAMAKLHEKMKDFDPEKMQKFEMRTPGPRFREEMEELRQQLDELKEELQDLKRELRESRGGRGSRSGS
jgi:membrane-associated protease RseP (regulator of RpoE activity)